MGLEVFFRSALWLLLLAEYEHFGDAACEHIYISWTKCPA